MSGIPPNSAVDTNQVTQYIKEMLNVGGKSHQANSSPDISLTNVSGSSLNGKSVADGMTSLHDSHNENDIPCPEDNAVTSELRSSPQIIAPQGNDEQMGFNVNSQDVTVYLGQNTHTSGSSKIKIQNIVDYGWEHKLYLGKLVSVHLSGKFIAYTLKAPSAASVLRVLNYTSGERILIKGMKGQVKDLAFAHITSQVILACVDDTGALFVYEIFEKDDKLLWQCLLHVETEADFQKSDYHRVIWCPYIPEDPGTKEDLSDMSKLLVVTNGNKAEMWDLDTVTKEYGDGSLKSENVKIGVQRIMEHEMPITDATFAPDGSALATASLDGEVKFFQVHGKNQESGPKCLHRWVPHAKKPLSCLFFLDNHKNPLPDVQFWKFAITGADNNREIKVWSCETWICLQTIRFVGNGDIGQPCLKAEMDLSASYLLLSEINRKMLYVLQLTQSPVSTVAHVTSLTEFPLSCPVLSLAVVSATRCKFKPSMGTEHIDKMSSENVDGYGVDGEEDLTAIEKYVEGTVLKAVWINTKSLQMSRIVYQSVEPASNQMSSSLSTISQDSSVSRDGLSDLCPEVPDPDQKPYADSSSSSGGSSDVKLNSSSSTSHPSTGTLSSSATSYFVNSPKSPLAAHSQSFRSGGEILLTPDDFTSTPLSSSSTTGASTISTPYTPASASMPMFPSMSTSASEDNVLSQARIDSRAPKEPSTTSTLTFKEEEENGIGYPEIGDLHMSSESSDVVRRKFSQHSSASSPSQEVADIMAPKKFSIQDHVEKEEEERVEPPVDPLSFPQPSLVEKPKANSVAPSKEWPDLPMPYKDFEGATRANSYPCAVPKHSSLAGPAPPLSSNLPSGGALVNVDFSSSSDKDSTRMKEDVFKVHDSLEAITSSLSMLTDLVRSQDSALKEMQTRMKEYASQQSTMERMDRRLSLLEESLAAKLDQSVSLQMQKELGKVDCSLSKLEELDKQWFEKQSAVLSNTFMASLNTKIEKAIKNEVKATIAPQVTKFLDTWREQLHQELSQKFAPTEQYIKESVSRLYKNKAFMESFGTSLAYSVQTHTQTATREVFQNVVIPSFEKVCHTLFTQLNEAFEKGTREFLLQIKNFQESGWQTFSNTTEKSLLDVGSKVAETKTSMEQILQSRLTELEEDLKKQQNELLCQFQDSVVSRLKSAVSEEVSSIAWGHQGASGPSSIARSRAVTPAAHQMLDPQLQQQHIMQLLRQGHVNSAFQQALSASNLSLVVAVCEAISPSQVFNQTPCPLQQPVLLSLIQQLAADLSSHTQLKLSYIEEAIMNLDTGNPVTREHMTAILRTLHQKLSSYIQNNQPSNLTRHARVLLLASQSIIHS